MSSFPSTLWSRLKHRSWFDRGPAKQFLTPLSRELPIFYIRYGGDYRTVYRALGTRRAAFLVRFLWVFEGERKAAKLARRVKNHRRRYPGQRFIFLCNTPSQRRDLTNAGIEAIFASTNGFLDERIYDIQLDRERRFDALYDAQIAPFKRHALAARVESLALIAYAPAALDKAYADEVLRTLSHAHWFRNPLDPNDSGGLYPPQVARAINECRVGLCLSAEEGAMQASAQYLLCGLPIVSTRSRGGRDQFFEPEFVRIVDDDPAAVASAVAELVALELDPRPIREATVPKILEHRGRVIESVANLYREAGVAWHEPEDWDAVFFNKMVEYSDVRRVSDILARGELPPPSPRAGQRTLSASQTSSRR